MTEVSISPSPGRPHAVFLSISILIFAAFGANLFMMTNNDIWWHLKTGEWILQHQAVPYSDPFAQHAGDGSWIDHEWLFQVTAYTLHRIFKIPGLVVLRAVIAALIAVSLHGLLRARGFPPIAAAAVIILSSITIRERLFIRPEMLSLLMLALLLQFLERAREGYRGSAVYAFLLGAVWANLHAACVLGIAVGGAYLTGAVVAALVSPGRAGRGRQASFTLLWTVLAFSLGTVLNPYGVRLHTVPFVLARIVAKPWAQNLEWLRPPVLAFPWYYLLLALALCETVRRALRREADLPRVMTLAGVALMSVLQVRHIGFFAVSALLAFARRPGLAKSGSQQPHKEGVLSWVSVMACLAVLAIAVFKDPVRKPGFTMDASAYPVREAAFIQSEGLEGPLFNEVGHGGYLLYRLYPRIVPFIDGRNEVHAALLREIFESLKDSQSFEALLTRHKIRLALLRYQPELVKVEYEKDGKQIRAARAFSAVYFHRKRWALVYWDDQGMVLVKRERALDAFIRAHEYTEIHPEDWRFIRDKAARSQIRLDAVRGELRRKLTENPECVRAKYLVRVFSKLGR